MKLSSFSTIILLQLTISSILFILPTQATLPGPSLIDNICRKTPHYQLCIMTLRSHMSPSQPISGGTADVVECARITLKIVAANAPAVISDIKKLYDQTDKAAMKSAFNGCISSYTKITEELCPKALSNLDKGDYTDVIHDTLTIGNLVASCDKRCAVVVASALVKSYGSASAPASASDSPVQENNQYMQKMCAITVSIVNRLAQTKQQTLD